MTTNPVIEGCLVGRRVDGDKLGVIDGEAVGTLVMNTASLSTSHSTLATFSKASIDAFTSSVFVASIVNCTSAVTPNSGAMITSQTYIFELMLCNCK